MLVSKRMFGFLLFKRNKIEIVLKLLFTNV